MRTRIYQINTERDESHLKFLPFQESPIDASVYDEVFNAELPTDNLEEVFRKFNTESHFLFRGHFRVSAPGQQQKESCVRLVPIFPGPYMPARIFGQRVIE